MWRRAYSGFTGTITPYDDPQEWYIKKFPTREVMEDYALRYSLLLREEKKDDLT